MRVIAQPPWDTKESHSSSCLPNQKYSVLITGLSKVKKKKKNTSLLLAARLTDGYDH